MSTVQFQEEFHFYVILQMISSSFHKVKQ